MKRLKHWLIQAAVAAGIVATAASFTPAAAEQVTLSQVSNDLATVTEQARAVVVNISTSRAIKTPRLPFSNDPFFRRFFGDRQRRHVRRLPASDLGSSSPRTVIL